MDDILKKICNDYFIANDKEFILLLNCVDKYTLKAVDSTIKVFIYTYTNNISVDKIEFICAKKGDCNVIYIFDYEDDITIN
ncbi:hypothetical protein ACH36K_06190 [Clostridium sp. MB05]|jgi:hypothetical protein|uniref:hypothetical protein n=1 Tax=Clostridium sp. MB05 TaxID=3376682 RepID=UPI003982524D